MKCPLRVVVALILRGLGFVVFLVGCSALPSRPASPTRDRAYIKYWPATKGDTHLRLAVKDVIDMKGVVTTAGSRYFAEHNAPASSDAACLALAREQQVTFVGKTNLSEMAVGVAGLNEFYGTPRNQLQRHRTLIPGGSSSGSAVAVANGSADVAFGTDTAGSVRVPAACCGVFGMKTTFGLVPLKGVFPLSPEHTDTVGPLAKDVPRMVKGMELLQRDFASKYEAAVAAKPTARSIRIGRLYVNGTDPTIDKAIDEALTAAGFKIVVLGESFRNAWTQAQKDGTTVIVTDVWKNCRQYADKAGVSTVTKLIIGHGETHYPDKYQECFSRRRPWQRMLSKAFTSVDFIALPTLQSLPPRIPFFMRSVLLETQVLAIQNTEAISFAGNPALAIPVPLKDGKVRATSLQLVGPRFSEAGLLNVARLMEQRS